MPSEDKQGMLRALCENVLGAYENILLDAECSVYRRHWPFPALGSGRAFLTNFRLIWIRRLAPPGLEALSKLVAPDMIDVPHSRIERLTRERWGINSFLVHLRSDVGEYFYRLGLGPFPFLRKNPETSNEWFERLNALMKETERKNYRTSHSFHKLVPPAYRFSYPPQATMRDKKR